MAGGSTEASSASSDNKDSGHQEAERDVAGGRVVAPGLDEVPDDGDALLRTELAFSADHEEIDGRALRRRQHHVGRGSAGAVGSGRGEDRVPSTMVRPTLPVSGIEAARPLTWALWTIVVGLFVGGVRRTRTRRV